MKITNNSTARQGIRTDAGLTWIAPGETRDVEPSKSGLKQAKRLKFLKIEGVRAEAKEPKPAAKAAPSDTPADAGLKAVHRGRGSFSIMRGDEEVKEGLSKDDADAFNEMSADDREAYVKG